MAAMHAMWMLYKNKSKVQNSVLDYTVCMYMDEKLGTGGEGLEGYICTI